MFRNLIEWMDRLLHSVVLHLRSGFRDFGSASASILNLAGGLGRIRFLPAALLMFAHRSFWNLCQSRALQVLVACVLFGFVAVGLVWYFAYGSDRQIKHHQSSATAQIKAGNYERAVNHLEQLSQLKGNLNLEESEQYLTAVRHSGDSGKYRALVAKLAPEPGSGKPGLPEAHRVVAIELANRIKLGESNELDRVRWHLQNSDDFDSLEMSLAQGRYSLAMGEHENAVRYFEKAARVNAVYFLNVALIYERLGQDLPWQQTLAEAEESMQIELARSPDEVAIRLAYAEVLFKLNRFDECDDVLVSAPVKSTDFSKARSDLLLRRFLDLNEATGVSNRGDDSGSGSGFEIQLSLLKRSIELSFDNTKIHAALLQFYGNLDSLDKKQAVLEMLNLVSDRKPGVVAFLQASMYALDHDAERALLSAEIALQHDLQNHRIQNLLAWSMSQVPNADLHSAEKHARDAVAGNENNAAYRMTLGRILWKKREYKLATVELEQSLLRSESRLNEQQRLKVHELLFKSYEMLQRYDLANIHAEKFLSTSSADSKK